MQQHTHSTLADEALRLRAACEKVKKVLSANAEAPLAIECLMEDTDIRGKMTRDEFEAMAAPLLARLAAPVKACLEQAGVKAEPDACALLIQYIGEEDLHGLASEITKVATWAQGEPVGVSEIAAKERPKASSDHRATGLTPNRSASDPKKGAKSEAITPKMVIGNRICVRLQPNSAISGAHSAAVSGSARISRKVTP